MKLRILLLSPLLISSSQSQNAVIVEPFEVSRSYLIRRDANLRLPEKLCRNCKGFVVIELVTPHEGIIKDYKVVMFKLKRDNTFILNIPYQGSSNVSLPPSYKSIIDSYIQNEVQVKFNQEIRTTNNKLTFLIRLN